MKENNLTVFLTTHYMEEVSDSNYVVIIDEGNIVGEGSPSELKDKYATDILKVYTKRSKEVNGILDSLARKYTYVVDHYEIQVESSNDAMKLINAHPNIFSNFEVIKGNMDQVFLNITGKTLKEHI
jgi:multidrug/hemolysin transport system ATP-binding protein